MLRHGESIWNVEKRFTGWCDVPLTSHGHADARDAGRLLFERGMKFDVAFTSKLERAWKTCESALAYSAQPNVPIVHSRHLNERHYGILQGHYKDCPHLAAAFGEERIMQWRKSFNDSPPTRNDIGLLLYVVLNRYSIILTKITEQLTGSQRQSYLESLKTYDEGYQYTTKRGAWRNLMVSEKEEELLRSIPEVRHSCGVCEYKSPC
jgi:bisphosphoglycerate-dependent phosphoglycerate mutase family 1